MYTKGSIFPNSCLKEWIFPINCPLLCSKSWEGDWPQCSKWPKWGHDSTHGRTLELSQGRSFSWSLIGGRNFLWPKHNAFCFGLGNYHIGTYCSLVLIKVCLANIEHLLKSMMVWTEKSTVICIALNSLEVWAYTTPKSWVIENDEQVI